jgi:F420-non-reducing hydrogenase iron-sulfur subunit
MSNTGAAIAPSGSGKSVAANERVVVAYICENAGRAGVAPSSGLRRRPTTPDFGWPIAVTEIVVPCAGRLQPEHFLKVFEDGADAIGVICCEEGNCHHLEGNRRCARRLAHVDGLLKQIGLGGERLRIFHLPGSAQEDMALGSNPQGASNAPSDPAMGRKVAAVRDAFVVHLATVSPNPMRRGALPDESPHEVENDDDSDE